MDNQLIPVQFKKIMQTRAFTAIVLSASEKDFAIYTDPNIGRNLQFHLSNTPISRPLTHDLIGLICKGFEIDFKQVVISKIEDTTFFAKLFLEQRQDGVSKIVESDARPSDCLTIALMKGIPVYCTKQVAEEAIPHQD